MIYLDALKYYIHTINGKAAQYDGEQIVYASISGNKLVRTLSQIKKEQRATKKWRKEEGFDLIHRYGHVLYRTPPIED